MFDEPQSMNEVLYYTNRSLGENADGSIICWVRKQLCPKCKKELMGKPRDSKGKVKMRSPLYECPSCHFTAEKKPYEESLTAQVNYTCPSCKKKGSSETQFKRKNIEGIPTLRFLCEHCKANLDVTKKMKAKKGEDGAGDDD